MMGETSSNPNRARGRGPLAGPPTADAQVGDGGRAPTAPRHRRAWGGGPGAGGAAAGSGLGGHQVNTPVNGPTPDGCPCAGPHFAQPLPSYCPTGAGPVSAGGPASFRRGLEGGVG